MKINTFLEDLGKYGKYESLKAKKVEAYVFYPDMEKINEEFRKLSTIPILIKAKDNETIAMYIYILGAALKKIEEKLGCIVNDLNSHMEYGKVYVDNDGDVAWSSTIGLDTYNSEDIKKHIESGIFVVLQLLSRVYNNEKCDDKKQ